VSSTPFSRLRTEQDPLCTRQPTYLPAFCDPRTVIGRAPYLIPAERRFRRATLTVWSIRVRLCSAGRPLAHQRPSLREARRLSGSAPAPLSQTGGQGRTVSCVRTQIIVDAMPVQRLNTFDLQPLRGWPGATLSRIARRVLRVERACGRGVRVAPSVAWPNASAPPEAPCHVPRHRACLRDYAVTAADSVPRTLGPNPVAFTVVYKKPETVEAENVTAHGRPRIKSRQGFPSRPASSVARARRGASGSTSALPELTQSLPELTKAGRPGSGSQYPSEPTKVRQSPPEPTSGS
jgi:hypothetical protein